MKRVFVELRAFSRVVHAAGWRDDQLSTLQRGIMSGAGSTIAGTGGLRKIRSGEEGRGKRGGWRVVFADYPAWSVTVLICAYPKSAKEDLTPDEKKELRDLKGQLDAELERRYG